MTVAYLIFEILWFLVAAAGLGLAVGWLCRSLTAPRRPEARTRVRGGQELPREQLEERLAEALAGGKALQDELDQARQREQEQRSKLEAREAEVARLSADLAARRAQFAMPLPPDTVTSPLTPGPLEVTEPEAGEPPEGLAAPQGAADDLKRIGGVGQSIERALNQNGIFHYRQIAGLTLPNIAWLDHHLRLKGRIEREDWIGQAKSLLADDLAEPGPLARQK
jgi:predicted flap endonuclease-1-like 5' DNA nuclease